MSNIIVGSERYYFNMYWEVEEYGDAAGGSGSEATLVVSEISAPLNENSVPRMTVDSLLHPCRKLPMSATFSVLM